jgi:hypothetical protein
VLKSFGVTVANEVSWSALELWQVINGSQDRMDQEFWVTSRKNIIEKIVPVGFRTFFFFLCHFEALTRLRTFFTPFRRRLIRIAAQGRRFQVSLYLAFQ